MLAKLKKHKIAVICGVVAALAVAYYFKLGFLAPAAKAPVAVEGEGPAVVEEHAKK